MAINDILLLDQLIGEFSQQRALDAGDAFELFAISELLKDFDLSQDELELGIVDGRDDGGIDGWYLFVDGELASEPDDVPIKRDVATIQIFILTAKHHATFKQEPVVNLQSTLSSILDFTQENESLYSRFNEEVLACRSTLKDVLLRTAKSGPKISIDIYYLSRGDVSNIGSSIAARSDALVEELKQYFSNSEVRFSYFGASEILEASRKLKDFSSVLVFEEAPVSRGLDNYVGLVRLPDYMSFVRDEDGGLRRYLFEANVRDFMGQTFVNHSILKTLERESDEKVEDFWWLNNGITVIADRASLIGKQLHLENVQIVNGLQTTETVYKHFHENEHEDSRCILVKVLVAPEKELADSIILATNNQNKVDFASLRATDTIQRNIEDLLLANDWYYDRRKNYYLNHGKPITKIVSMKYMAWAIISLLLGQPSEANRARPKQLLVDRLYQRIFSDRYDLRVYLSALEIAKHIEMTMLREGYSDEPYDPRAYATMYRFLYAHLYVTSVVGNSVRNDKDLIEVSGQDLLTEHFHTVHEIVVAGRKKLRKRNRNIRRLHRNQQFQDNLTAEVLRHFVG